jgi:hypothetical protein
MVLEDLVAAVEADRRREADEAAIMLPLEGVGGCPVASAAARLRCDNCGERVKTHTRVNELLPCRTGLAKKKINLENPAHEDFRRSNLGAPLEKSATRDA